jgi:hypothetical protein
MFVLVVIGLIFLIASGSNTPEASESSPYTGNVPPEPKPSATVQPGQVNTAPAGYNQMQREPEPSLWSRIAEALQANVTPAPPASTTTAASTSDSSPGIPDILYNVNDRESERI